MSDDRLIASLRAAVIAAPDDLLLRMHLAELLLDAGQPGEATAHLAAVLERQPSSDRGRELMLRALGAGAAMKDPPDGRSQHDPSSGTAFDWKAAEAEFASSGTQGFERDGAADREDLGEAFDVEPGTVRLSDVGGLDAVKERLQVSFLGPAREPELRRLFGKSLRGGLLLYGPPGCGKSFLARALAGELGAGFVSLQLHEVLDMWLGASERNLHELFRRARRAAPCVLFIDELDAIGQRRTQLRGSALRTTVNQLLAELDGVGERNEGLYVIGATNHPWDVDSALKRPGRFDSLVFVPPPDSAAREAIFASNLKDRPVEGVNVHEAARRSAGLSGADIAHVCDSAAGRALRDSIIAGQVRRITMRDVEAALAEVRPSTGAWFDTARNVVQFANESGEYDELREHMRAHRLL